MTHQIVLKCGHLADGQTHTRVLSINYPAKVYLKRVCVNPPMVYKVESVNQGPNPSAICAPCILNGRSGWQNINLQVPRVVVSRSNYREVKKRKRKHLHDGFMKRGLIVIFKTKTEALWKISPRSAIAVHPLSIWWLIHKTTEELLQIANQESRECYLQKKMLLGWTHIPLHKDPKHILRRSVEWNPKGKTKGRFKQDAQESFCKDLDTSNKVWTKI